LPHDARSGQPSDKLSGRADEVSSAFADQYEDYQYCFVEFLVAHLIDVSRAFDGDMQTVLVLAVIGQARLHAVRRTEAAGLDPQSMPAERESTNASRIADVTGIPRQTVRRKLAALEHKGWIQRDQAGSYRLVFAEVVSTARRDLSDLDRRAIVRVSKLFVELEKLVDNHTPRPE